MIGLQVKIEYDAIMADDGDVGLLTPFVQWLRNKKGSGQNVNDIANKLEQNLKSIRIVLASCLFLTLLTVYQQNGGGSISKWNLLVAMAFLTVVIPLTVVSKHDSIRKVALKSLTFYLYNG